jgi:hypothetical protein
MAIDAPCFSGRERDHHLSVMFGTIGILNGGILLSLGKCNYL